MSAGTHSWASGGNEKRAGITPMIVKGVPSSVAVRPSTALSAPKRSRQRASLSTATVVPAPWTSDESNSRPSAGETPSTVKYSGLTAATPRRAGSPARVSVAWRSENVAIASNARAPCRTSSKCRSNSP